MVLRNNHYLFSQHPNNYYTNYKNIVKLRKH